MKKMIKNRQALKEFIIAVSISCFITLCFIGLYLPGAKINHQLQVKRGQLDLRDYNFAQAGPLALNGEWEFSWISPQGLSFNTYAFVPSSWRKFKWEGQALPSSTRVDEGRKR